jgi:hypothetical protein
MTGSRSTGRQGEWGRPGSRRACVLVIVSSAAACRGILGIQPLPALTDGAADGASAGEAAAPTDAPADAGAAVGDASGWTVEMSGVATDLLGVWGALAPDGGEVVYAVGAQSVILRSVGDGVWSPQSAGVTGLADVDGSLVPTSLLGVAGTGPNDVYVAAGAAGHVLQSTDETTWSGYSSFGIGADFNCVWVQGATPYVGVSGYGIIVLGDGGASGPQPVFHYNVLAIWGSAANDLYAGCGDGAGSAYVLHSTGDGKWAQETFFASTLGVTGVWGSSGSDVYAVGSSEEGGAIVAHSTGNGAWTAATLPAGVGPAHAVWGAGPSDIYVAAEHGVLHYGGQTWAVETDSALGERLWYGVWGSQAGDVYLVGSGGAILHHR